jgi:hypothetical protein
MIVKSECLSKSDQRRIFVTVLFMYRRIVYASQWGENASVRRFLFPPMSQHRHRDVKMRHRDVKMRHSDVKTRHRDIKLITLFFIRHDDVSIGHSDVKIRHSDVKMRRNDVKNVVCASQLRQNVSQYRHTRKRVSAA